MHYMTSADAAKLWNVSQSFVQEYAEMERLKASFYWKIDAFCLKMPVNLKGKRTASKEEYS